MISALQRLAFVLTSATGLLAAQGLGVDAVSLGPLAVHDHIVFDYHFPVKGDPNPHETKEGYAFDGVDVIATVHWHWGRSHLATALRVTPASRLHFAYDQDTDFTPGNAFTHGNEGLAKSRTFGLDQSFPLVSSTSIGRFSWDFALLRQWTRYHQVTTYDLNSNPALTSNIYTRLISERAIVYELRPSVSWNAARSVAEWDAQAKLSLTPLSAIFLRNYIPVTLAATSLEAYGGALALGLGHSLGDWHGPWHAQLVGAAGWYTSYRGIEGFRREEFTLRLEISPPL